MIVAKHAIDVFEGTIGGFGVEKVDNGDEGGVENCPDDVEFPLQALNANWRDFDNCEIFVSACISVVLIEVLASQTHVIKGPVRCRADSSPLCPHGERVDLGGVQPRDTLKSNAKEDVVSEKEGYRC